MKIFMRQICMAAFASVVTFTGIAPAGAFQVPQMPSQVTSSSDIIKVQDANGQGSRRQFEEWRRRPGGGDWDRRGDRNRDRNWDRRSDNNRDWDRRRPSREWDRRRPPRDWDRPSYRAGYYNGHRGYRYRRPGYRYYDGFWFPLAAFGSGAIIGGAIASPPPVAVYPGSYSPSHVQWCLNRYRSYRASDNSFVPYTGYRQQCVSPYS